MKQAFALLGVLVCGGIFLLGLLVPSQDEATDPKTKVAKGEQEVVTPAESVGDSSPVEQAKAEVAVSDLAAREVLDEKLDRAVAPVVTGVTVEEYITYISDVIDADVVIDESAFDDVSYTGQMNRKIDFVVEHTSVSARRALDAVLDPLELAAVNDNGFLRITTKGMSEELLYLVAYDMTDRLDAIGRHSSAQELLQEDEHVAGPFPTRESEFHAMVLDELVDVIQQATDGPWVEYDGAGGVIVRFDQQLIVYQHDAGHRAIRELLRQWRVNQESRLGDE